MKRNVSRPRITHLDPDEIFVFGSNLAGIHGAGAANQALNCFGARWGEGVGLAGQSYAIPTKDAEIETMSPEQIGPYVLRFLNDARKCSHLKFLVTEIGCGLAGLTPADIVPLFGVDIPDNVWLPQSFWDIIDQ